MLENILLLIVIKEDKQKMNDFLEEKKIQDEILKWKQSNLKALKIKKVDSKKGKSDEMHIEIRLLSYIKSFLSLKFLGQEGETSSRLPQ